MDSSSARLDFTNYLNLDKLAPFFNIAHAAPALNRF